MRIVRTFLPALALVLVCVVYMLLPLATQDAGGALLSCAAIGVVLLAILAWGYVPSPRHWHVSQWLLVACIGSVFVSVLLSKNYAHALWGFSFDMTSAFFLLFVFVLPLIVGGLPVHVRRIIFLASCVSLALLLIYPLVRSEVYVRPSNDATMGIEAASYADGGTRALLVGVGPNSFLYAWQKYRPTAVLTTPFWNEDFPVGGSVLATLMIECGVLSVLLLCLAYLSACAEEVWRSLTEEYSIIRKSLYTLPAWIVLGSLFALMFAEPSAPLVLVCGMLLGSFRFHTEPRIVLGPWTRGAGVVVGVAYLCVVAYIATAVIFYFSAFSKVQAQDLTSAQHTGEYSYQLYKNPQTARFLSQTFRSLGHELGRTHVGQDTIQASFHAASAYARAATVQEPQNGQNWKLLGISLAEELALQKNAAFFSEGKKAFDTAAVRIPADPSIFFFEAQLYILAGDREGAKSLLDKALALKPDYTEANDLRTAIQ